MVGQKVLAALRRIRFSEGVAVERLHMLVRDIEADCPDVEARIPITCEKLDPAQLEALAVVDVWQRSLDELKRQAAMGRIFFVARHNADIIAATTVETGRATTIDCTIPLREEEACTAKDFTVPEYRGNAVSPALRSFISKWLASAGFRRLVTFVNVKNTSSLKSVGKTGYRSVGTVGCIEFFGLHWSYCLARDARWRYRQKEWLAPGSEDRS